MKMEDMFSKRRKKGKITNKLKKEKRNFSERSPIIKKMYL